MNILKIYLLIRNVIMGVVEKVNGKIERLRLRAETGSGSSEWVLIIIGVIALAAIVIGAVTAYVQSQTAKLK